MNDFIEYMKGKDNSHVNLCRKDIIREVIENKEAFISKSGAFSTVTSPESTGRQPKLTFIVEGEDSDRKVDFSSPACIKLDKNIFDRALEEVKGLFEKKDKVYICDKVAGAETKYALPIKLITDKALTTLFSDNMFREVPEDIENSLLYDKKFTILVLPDDYITDDEYIQTLINSKKDSRGIMIAMDFDRSIGIVVGSAYLGSVKKLIFTVMNYYLPDLGVLPLHCSANVGGNKETALFLGLSGTGKTTLSYDHDRLLIGDDEHGWHDEGICNFENGCYAKLINLKREKEPEIYDAIFKKSDVLESGCIVENALMFPNGTFDVDDSRLTENSRGSYTLDSLENVDISAKGNHPKYVLFLTADANGVLPPVSKLDKKQASYWFYMGYTSKLAGTEAGITEPKTTFSRFFGEPFMPRHPRDYMDLLERKMEEFNTKVFLVNTGWSGGCYGEGERMDINLTKNIVRAILRGDLDSVDYKKEKFFNLSIPESCPNVDSKVLKPWKTWKDKSEYEVRAAKLQSEFKVQSDRIGL